MPLVHSEKINQHCILLVWKLTESEEELLEQLQCNHNDQDLIQISHPQKRREWLSSRLLVKSLTELLGLKYEGTYKDTHGKLYLRNHDAEISITHSLDYVAGIIHESKEVGIDMEAINPKLQRTARKYLDNAEFEHAEDDLTLLAMYWCAKEAIYKLHGKNKVSFKDNIRIAPFDKAQHELQGQIMGIPQIISATLLVRWFETYCLVVAI
jgi:4'-phosphopantetheinyl transferase